MLHKTTKGIKQLHDNQFIRSPLTTSNQWSAPAHPHIHPIASLITQTTPYTHTSSPLAPRLGRQEFLQQTLSSIQVGARLPGGFLHRVAGPPHEELFHPADDAVLRDGLHLIHGRPVVARCLRRGPRQRLGPAGEFLPPVHVWLQPRHVDRWV